MEAYKCDKHIDRHGDVGSKVYLPFMEQDAEKKAQKINDIFEINRILQMV